MDAPRRHNEPRVTVVVTSYNQAQWIEQALDSVREQTEPRWQLIVTDDGSDDDSVEVIQNWLIRWNVDATLIRSERNVGLPAMLNRALPLISGTYLVVLNGDDWMDQDRLRIQASHLDTAEELVGLVYSDLRVVDADGVPTGEIFPDPGVERREGDVLAHIVARPMIGMPSVMVRSDVLQQIGPWDESLVADDFDFFLRVAAAGYHFEYLPRQLLNYRKYETSLTGGRAAELAEGRFRALKKLLGRDPQLDSIALERMEGLVISLHGSGYDRAATRRHLRFVLRRRQSKRLVRAAIENQLRLPPQSLAFGRLRGVRRH